MFVQALYVQALSSACTDIPMHGGAELGCSVQHNLELQPHKNDPASGCWSWQDKQQPLHSTHSPYRMQRSPW